MRRAVGPRWATAAVVGWLGAWCGFGQAARGEEASGTMFVGRLARDGSLDPSFAGGGLSLWNPETGLEHARALLLDSSARIVLGGSVVVGDHRYWSLVRLRRDGLPDRSFGWRGRVMTDWAGSNEGEIHDLVLDSSGRLLAVGEVKVDGRTLVALARYDRDGFLDASFGHEGRVLTELPGSLEGRARQIVLDPLGRMVVAGEAWTAEGSFLFVARYQRGGWLDRSFGTDGLTSTEIPGATEVSLPALVLDRSARPMAAGSVAFPKNEGETFSVFLVARWERNGGLDPAYGGGSGLVMTAFPSARQAAAGALVLESSGRAVVAGHTWSAEENGGLALARYERDGRLDTSFGEDGVVLTESAAWTGAEGRALVLDSSSRPWVGGSVELARGTSLMAVVRYERDGSLDEDFGESSLVTKELEGWPRAVIRAAELDSLGRLVLLGEVER